MNWPEYTRRFGRHSNIPECCIEAFINGNTYPDRFAKYGRCRTCINTGHRVKVHFCTTDCIPFLQSIGIDPMKFGFKEQRHGTEKGPAVAG